MNDIKNKVIASPIKVFSKGKDYLDTVIKIIIFLIFLNLFITTYFYFTTSIQATANRSNCGGASICEAETHRHLFLEDNGNDKARDIYIIIVVIFSIYLLSEIFKSYSEDGINFNNTDTKINSISQIFIFVCFFGSMLLVQWAKYYFNTYKDEKEFKENIKNQPMLGFMIAYSVLSFIAIFSCIYIALYQPSLSILIKFIMGIIVSISLGYDIHNFINKSTSDSFESKSFGSKSFNSKFKAKTAIDILLITFYSISIVVLFVLRDVNNITIPIIALSLLAVLMATLYIFILNSSLDWSRYANNDDYNKYFEIFHRSIFVISGTFPVLLAFFFSSESNIIKLIVFYYAILFIIYLFYVYFINHNNESGILSLAYFQLYNYLNIQKNENTKGSDNTNDETKNYYKQFNQINVYFVVVLLIILIIIGGLNKDSNLDNIIYGIIAFIIASYITGIVYLLYNTVFPIQQASFNYKKNLVDINNEISQHIKVELEEHTIDINKIRIFKIANSLEDIKEIHDKINSERGDGTKGKEMHMKNIRDIFSEISPKGSSYEDYRSQSIDQMQYEEYIYLLFSDNTTKAITSTYSVSKIYNILNNALNLKRYTDKLHNIYKTVLKDRNKKPSLTTIDSIRKYYTNNIYNDTLKEGLQTILDKYKDEYFTKIYNENYDKNTEIVSITNVLILGAPIANNKVYDVFSPDAELQEILNDLKNIYSASNNLTVFEQYIKDVITDMVSYLKLEYTQGSTENATPTNYSKINLYNKIIIDVPTNIENLEDAHNIYTNVSLNIPKTNNIEYVIKKNYKYVTGEEGEIQKYKVLSEKELDCLYYREITEEPDSSNQTESGTKLAESIEAIKNIKTMNDVIITNIATVTTYQEIYKLNQDIFDHYKTNYTIGDNIIIKLGTKKYENITHSSITSTESTESTEYEKLNPAFYTIGYDYENYTEDHQQMNKDTAYSIPARYYACSYLNYFPNEDGSMSKVKFAKNIKEDNYNPLNTKNTIIDRIAKSYNANAEETKIQLAPEKFHFLLVFLVILAIILLMFLFNIIKKYFTGDVYTPQMYVLGILGVFLTIFIFGEVIFARLK